MSRFALQDASARTLAAVPGPTIWGRRVVGLVLLAFAACRGTGSPGADALPVAASDVPQSEQAREAQLAAHRAEMARSPMPTESPVERGRVERVVEVQHIIDEGADPGRLARFISLHTAEQPALLARRTALAALRTERDRSVRLAALVDAGHAPDVKPEDDPLWPDLVQALSETWAAANTVGGRKRMLHEKDPRTRLLLVSSLAVYAGSNRGLSDMTVPQRRALRAEFMRLYPALPPGPQQQVDTFAARINVNARGTLP